VKENMKMAKPCEKNKKTNKKPKNTKSLNRAYREDRRGTNT